MIQLPARGTTVSFRTAGNAPAILTGTVVRHGAAPGNMIVRVAGREHVVTGSRIVFAG